MANNEKPRNKGLGEYAKDFAEGLLGRDNDDANNAAAQQRDDEPSTEKPRDKGIAEYTKDFVGGLFGRDDDDQSKPRQEAPAEEQKLPDRMTNAIEEAKERAAAQARTQGGVMDSVNNAVEEARKRAEEAQNAAKPKPQTSGGKPNNPFATQQNKPQAAPAGPPKPPAAAPAPDAAEVERLRERVAELERQHAAEAAPAPAPAPQQRTYTVKPGDSMRRIAQQFYGDEMKWKRIYEANRDKIKNPDLIHPGQEFIIPD